MKVYHRKVARLPRERVIGGLFGYKPLEEKVKTLPGSDDENVTL